MAQYDITIMGRDYDAMADVVRKHKISVLGHTARKLAKRGFSVRALATTAQVHALQKAGYKVKQHEDLDKAGRKRQAEFKRAQKKKGLRVEGAAVAAAETYLSVADVEAALAAAAASPNDTFVTLIKLPNKTWENRECHAVKIAKGSSHGRSGIYFLGGVHAREWGSPDILINFVQQLTDAPSAARSLQRLRSRKSSTRKTFTSFHKPIPTAAITA
jgi:carboxypeptidase T